MKQGTVGETSTVPSSGSYLLYLLCPPSASNQAHAAIHAPGQSDRRLLFLHRMSLQQRCVSATHNFVMAFDVLFMLSRAEPASLAGM